MARVNNLACLKLAVHRLILRAYGDWFIIW
jgi:hypothetical protein